MAACRLSSFFENPRDNRVNLRMNVRTVTLMPSIPAWMRSRNVRAAAPDCVKREAVLPQHLRHSGPADIKVAGERRPALELAGVEQRLVISCECERITGRKGKRGVKQSVRLLRCGWGRSGSGDFEADRR
jgi:hypothetical protein